METLPAELLEQVATMQGVLCRSTVTMKVVARLGLEDLAAVTRASPRLQQVLQHCSAGTGVQCGPGGGAAHPVLARRAGLER